MKDPALRACTVGARGLWTDMLCLMFESVRRGYLQHATGKPVTAEQLARMTGCSTDDVSRLLQELEDSGVFSRTEHGVIYSRRMARDEGKRAKCVIAGKLGGNPTLKGRSKGVAKGDAKGGSNRNPTPSSSSSSSSSDLPPSPPAGGIAGDPPGTGPPTPDLGGSPDGAGEADPEPGPEAVPPWADLIGDWVAARLPGHDLPDGIQRTSSRVGRWQLRLRDRAWAARWREAVARAGASARCRGAAPGWELTIDMFLSKPDMLVRILEGEFDDSRRNGGGRGGAGGGNGKSRYGHVGKPAPGAPPAAPAAGDGADGPPGHTAGDLFGAA